MISPGSDTHPIYDRPIGVFAVLAAIVLLGFLLLPRLAVDIWPSFRSQSIFIRAFYEGASSEETLEEVTRPIEGMLRGVAGIDSVSSRTRNGRVFLVASPSEQADPREILAAITDVLAAQAHLLPADVQPRVGSWSNEDSPPIAFAVGAGALSQAAFRHLLDEALIPALSSIDGVAAASYGDEDPAQILVSIDRRRAQAQGVRAQDVAEQLMALESASVAFPSRNQAGLRSESVVHLRLDQAQGERIEAMSVNPRSQLGDVADIQASAQGSDRIVLVNGQPGALIAVYRTPEANGYRVSALAEARMRQLAEEHGFDLVVPTATHRTIQAAAGELADSALWGAGFAALFLLLFLRRLRLTLLVCLAIPTSFALAVIGLSISSAPVNIFTMVGLLLASGMLVDNSVVVGEALARAPGASLQREGLRLQRRAVASISMAIVLSTLTTIAIVAPFQYLDVGPLSAPINAIATPIVWSLIGSLCVALVISPILYAWLHPGQRQRSHQVAGWLRLLERGYGRCLLLLLRHPIAALLLLALLLALPTFLVLQNPTSINASASLETDERRAVLPIIRRGDVPLERFQSVATQWYQQLQPHLDKLGASGVVAEIGGRRSELHIYLQPIDHGLSSDQVADRVADILEPHLDLALQAHIDRAQGEAARSGSLPNWRQRRRGVTNSLMFVIRHPHADALAPAWDILRDYAQNLPGVTWLTPPLEAPDPTMELALDRPALAAGFRPDSLSWQIRRHNAQRHVVELADGSRISMGPNEQSIPTLAQLQALHMQSSDRRQADARLDALTSLSTVVVPDTIMRRDGQSQTQVRVNFEEGYRSAVKNALLDPALPQRLGAPEGSTVELTWWMQRGEDSTQAMLWAIVLAALTVFLVMAFSYESLIAPFAALASVPLALLCLIAWVAWQGREIGPMILIGSFFLVGIVVNNGIVLVDRLRHRVAPTRCDSSYRVAATIAAASRKRLAPILLTSLTTISAAVPMALGGASIAGLPMSELGSTIAVGLTGATLCTLLFVPLAYYWLGRLRRALGQWLAWAHARSRRLNKVRQEAGNPATQAASLRSQGRFYDEDL